ncbi:pentapeptide repeat-containing protein [Micromonospora rifamycinica]|uniref:pentapeptide repeat-containing protein n=1 Tax=Micromonospora rifamycinica TaxID=291594 RepID=UPI0033D8F6A3
MSAPAAIIRSTASWRGDRGRMVSPRGASTCRWARPTRVSSELSRSVGSLASPRAAARITSRSSGAVLSARRTRLRPPASIACNPALSSSCPTTSTGRGAGRPVTASSCASSQSSTVSATITRTSGSSSGSASTTGRAPTGSSTPVVPSWAVTPAWEIGSRDRTAVRIGPLRGAALRGAALRGAALRGAALRGAALRGAALPGPAVPGAVVAPGPGSRGAAGCGPGNCGSLIGWGRGSGRARPARADRRSRRPGCTPWCPGSRTSPPR